MGAKNKNLKRPAPRTISVYCPACENVYAITAAPGELRDRRCPYGHAGLKRGWVARIWEALR